MVKHAERVLDRKVEEKKHIFLVSFISFRYTFGHDITDGDCHKAYDYGCVVGHFFILSGLGRSKMFTFLDANKLQTKVDEGCGKEHLGVGDQKMPIKMAPPCKNFSHKISQYLVILLVVV